MSGLVLGPVGTIFDSLVRIREASDLKHIPPNKLDPDPTPLDHKLDSDPTSSEAQKKHPAPLEGLAKDRIQHAKHDLIQAVCHIALGAFASLAIYSASSFSVGAVVATTLASAVISLPSTLFALGCLSGFLGITSVVRQLGITTLTMQAEEIISKISCVVLLSLSSFFARNHRISEEKGFTAQRNKGLGLADRFLIPYFTKSAQLYQFGPLGLLYSVTRKGASEADPDRIKMNKEDRILAISYIALAGLFVPALYQASGTSMPVLAATTLGCAVVSLPATLFASGVLLGFTGLAKVIRNFGSIKLFNSPKPLASRVEFFSGAMMVAIGSCLNSASSLARIRTKNLGLADRFLIPYFTHSIQPTHFGPLGIFYSSKPQQVSLEPAALLEPNVSLKTDLGPITKKTMRIQAICHIVLATLFAPALYMASTISIPVLAATTIGCAVISLPALLFASGTLLGFLGLAKVIRNFGAIKLFNSSKTLANGKDFVAGTLMLGIGVCLNSAASIASISKKLFEFEVDFISGAYRRSLLSRGLFDYFGIPRIIRKVR